MSLKKILISTSVAALFAGSASALGVTQGDASTLGQDGATVLTVINAAAVVAEEATFAAVGSNMATFELTIASTGSFAASENYFVDVSVSGGSFAEQLTGAEVTNGNTAGSGLTISGASVQIAGQVQTGQVGETQVRYLVSNSPTIGDHFGIEVPVTYSGCPSNLTFTVTVTTSGGVTFEEGTVTLATPALSCANAYQATIATDVIGTANDTVLASSAFNTFLTSITSSTTDELATGTPVAGVNDTATSGSLGVITAMFDPAGAAAAFLTSLDLSSGALVGAGGEVASVDFDLSVASPAGVLSADFLQVPEAAVPMTTGSGSLSDSITVALAANDHVENIAVTIDGTTQIAQQDVTVSNASLVFSAPGVILSEPVADATLDGLNFEGVTCGEFDWVGDASKPTQNIFRVTGHGPATTSVVASIRNSSAGLNGSATLTQTYDFTKDEVVVNTTHLTNDLGNFGRADLLLNFIGAQQSLDCDRLMNSDSLNIITAFGNKDQTAASGDDGDDN